VHHRVSPLLTEACIEGVKAAESAPVEPSPKNQDCWGARPPWPPRPPATLC
jgi:hypothetical protein